MREREHLSRLGIRPVDEDQRRKRIGKRKAAEFSRIETPVIVIHDDSADHHKHANPLGLKDEQPECVGPRPALSPSAEVEAEGIPHTGCDFFGPHCNCGASDEAAFSLPRDADEISIPTLSFLTDVDRIQQIRTRASYIFPGEGAKVGDGHHFLRRFCEEQVTDRHVNGASKIFYLFRVGCVSPVSHSGNLLNRRINSSCASPARSRAQRRSSLLIATRVIGHSPRLILHRAGGFHQAPVSAATHHAEQPPPTSDS